MQAKTGRQINKIVPLPLEGSQSLNLDTQGIAPPEVIRPIHVYLTADSFDLKKLAAALRTKYRSADIHSISECVHCRVHQGGLASEPDDGFGELFFFEVRSTELSAWMFLLLSCVDGITTDPLRRACMRSQAAKLDIHCAEHA